MREESILSANGLSIVSRAGPLQFHLINLNESCSTMDSYRVEVADGCRRELRALPGNLRQRVFRNLQALRNSPRPDNSRPLDAAKQGVQLPPETDLLRIRVDSWRVVYLVDEAEHLVTVLAIRKRPPYLNDDIETLIESQ